MPLLASCFFTGPLRAKFSTASGSISAAGSALVTGGETAPSGLIVDWSLAEEPAEACTAGKASATAAAAAFTFTFFTFFLGGAACKHVICSVNEPKNDTPLLCYRPQYNLVCVALLRPKVKLVAQKVGCTLIKAAPRATLGCIQSQSILGAPLLKLLNCSSNVPEHHLK